MKKCPYCKADIESNARFCLYCMKPLNQKEHLPPEQKTKTWWPLAVAGSLLLVVLALILLIPGDPAEPSGTESTPSTQATEGIPDAPTESSTQPEETTASTIPQPTGTPTPTQPQAPKPGSIPIAPTEPTTPPTEPTTPAAPTQPPTTPPENTTPPTLPEELPEETVQETTQPEEPEAEVVYTYRAARTGDDFNAHYSNSGNDIVITGISQPAADGVYDIPSYIDGKKVIAIVANAFSGSNAKTVYVPATVKMIHNYAFAGCNLADIYFRGNAIYVETIAFNSALTIHCAATCSDRNFRYYKNCAANYGATWEEWNG